MVPIPVTDRLSGYKESIVLLYFDTNVSYIQKKKLCAQWALMHMLNRQSFIIAVALIGPTSFEEVFYVSRIYERNIPNLLMLSPDLNHDWIPKL